MNSLNHIALESNPYLKINFDGGDLSSDAGLLLIKEFAVKVGLVKLIYELDPVFTAIPDKPAFALQPTIS